MAKRKNLAESIAAANTDRVENAVSVEVESTPEVATPKSTKSSAPAKYLKPPSRINTKAITGHFDPDVSKQLKMLAVTKDSTVQALLREALNDLFVKHGQNPIA